MRYLVVLFCVTLVFCSLSMAQQNQGPTDFTASTTDHIVSVSQSGTGLGIDVTVPAKRSRSDDEGNNR